MLDPFRRTVTLQPTMAGSEVISRLVKAKKPLINPVDTEGHGMARSAARIMILFISLAFVSYPAEALTDAEKFVLETALQGTLNVEHDY